MNSPLLTIVEAAEYMRVNKSTVYILAKTKEFPAFKIGKEYRIVKEELDVWLKNQCLSKAE